MFEVIKRYLHSSYLLRENANILSGHFIKNTIFFMVGYVLLHAYGLIISVDKLVFAYFGFIFIYTSVYMFNDYFDYEDDKMYYTKKKYKASVYSGITKDELVSFGTLSLVMGLVFCSFVNIVYLQINLILLVLNLLHSNRILRFKEHLTLSSMNIFVLQTFKFAMPWFILIDKLPYLPWTLLLFFSSVYILSYALYKHHEFGSDKVESVSNVILFLGLALVTLFYSLYMFPMFRIGLIVSLALGIILYGLISKTVDLVSNIENIISVYNLCLITFVLCLLIF